MSDRLKQAESVSAQIDAAFAQVGCPAPHQLVHHWRTDVTTYGDLAESHIREEFAGKRRADIEAELQWQWVEDLSLMTPLAIHYYLPSFLEYVLRVQDDFFDDGCDDRFPRLLRRAGNGASIGLSSARNNRTPSSRGSVFCRAISKRTSWARRRASTAKNSRA